MSKKQAKDHSPLYRPLQPDTVSSSLEDNWLALIALLLVSLPTTQSHASGKSGGAYRDRTDDPLLAKQVLSQLSYTPDMCGGSGWIRTNDPRLIKTVL